MGILVEPEIVMKNGRPKAVILDIREYRRLLELAEDAYDRRTLNAMRRGKHSFRTFEAYLKSHKTRA
jgi:PHD/YefM family antitoxin component YafN of YafNO toxin-antitoxin module